MNPFKKYLALSIVLALCSQFETSSAAVTAGSKTGTPADETRNVSGFSGIASAGSYNVFITMGSKEGLRIEGTEEQISEIETVVESGVLKIRNKKHLKNLNRRSFNGKLNIYVYARSLNSITLSGSGDIEVTGLVKSADLSNTLSGSGSITLAADASNYSATISGSGGINVKGKTENARIVVSGSGNFKGSNLKTGTASVKVSSSGNISIFADQDLDAIMSGSGNIRYAGNASVRSTKSGSGNIRKL